MPEYRTDIIRSSVSIRNSPALAVADLVYAIYHICDVKVGELEVQEAAILDDLAAFRVAKLPSSFRTKAISNKEMELERVQREIRRYTGFAMALRNAHDIFNE